MEVAWDEQRGLWCGHADAGGWVEVAIAAGESDPDLARSYALFALSRLALRVGEARRYAARRLTKYYNQSNAHLRDSEQLTAEDFAGKLQLEGIRFGSEGTAALDFGHDLYRGHSLNDGGLVVVEAAADGRFRRAYWVTEPDAREARCTRCT